MIFYTSLIVNLIILFLVLWSIFLVSQRIWPPKSKKSWQYKIYWALYYLSVFLSLILVVRLFDSWLIAQWIRYFIGIPLMITGFVVMGIGVYWLGIANTYGVENGFKNHGIYKFTRNPQYIGDIALLFGIMIFVNSFELLIIFTIYILTFIAMIFSEESWLEERYGKEYIVYKSKTPRFIMKFSNNK